MGTGTAPHKAESIDQALSRLSTLKADGHCVLSLYLSFAPSEFPNLRERRIQADALLADVAHNRQGEARASHAARLALREDIERVRALLNDDEQLAVESARGLAVFCSTPAQLFEVVALPHPVEGAVRLQERPFLEPLVELASHERWCVLLTTRRTARVMRGTRERLVEVADVLDEVHGQHAQGGWAQARYQRGIEHEADEHIRRACATLYRNFQQRRFDRLLIACPSELRHRVEQELHPDLRSRLAGHFEIDIERATPDEVHRRAAPLIQADEQSRERAALLRLNEGLAPGGHAAAGLDEVLELLNERRVQTLLLKQGFTVSGFVCPRCGRLSTSAGPCPTDAVTPEPRENIIEPAIELAFHQAADVLVVHHQPNGLGEHGPIAALLRY